MRISLNTYRPQNMAYGQRQQHQVKQQNNPVNFKSGYGMDEIPLIDNPDLPLNTESERWLNILDGIKMMTVDAYKERHHIEPKKPAPLFTPEEAKRFREQFYRGTDLEGVDPKTLMPPEKEVPFYDDPDEI